MYSRENPRSSSKHKHKHSVAPTHDAVAPQSSLGCFSSVLSKSRSFSSLRKVVAPPQIQPPLPPPVPTMRTPPNAAVSRPPPLKNIPKTSYVEQPIMSPPPSLDTFRPPPTSGYTRPKAERRVHVPKDPYTNGPVSKQGGGYFVGPPPPPAPSESSNVYMRSLPSPHSRRRR
uniref:Uncharacterized protein n=1 Tax=Moniliophthora roreri TaxID=221103 RepID=A0A0W0FBF9_MONRR